MTKNNPMRADQILACAQKLFFENGYESTSLADIVAEAGVTKGAFYHHFSSKSEILEQLLGRLVSHFSAELEQAAREFDGAPLDAYLRFLEIVRSEFEFQSQQGNPEVGRALYLDANDSIRNKLFQRLSEAIIPVLSEILQHGVSGVPLTVTDANATAELVFQISVAHQPALKRLRYANSAAKSEELKQAVEDLLRHQERAIDRLLGLKEGTTILRSERALAKLSALGFQDR